MEIAGELAGQPTEWEPVSLRIAAEGLLTGMKSMAWTPSSLISTLIHAAPRSSYSASSFPGELLWIPQSLDYSECSPGDCLPALLLRCNHARYLLLYLHSNAEDIGTARHFAMGVRMLLGMHVLIPEYPGYGCAPGQYSEATLWQAAASAFRWACEVVKWPAEDIIVMGRSLGASLAIRLAGSNIFHGLILAAPFLSLKEAIGDHVGMLAPAVADTMYKNSDRITEVNVPTLVIHALNDKLVNCKHGQKLYELCPHEKKLLVCPATLGHNGDLLRDANYLIHPMLRLFSLPDYSLAEMIVPPQAFDKNLCFKYHAVFEGARDAKIISRHEGDSGPDIDSSAEVDLKDGPRAVQQGCPASSGDNDTAVLDLDEGCNATTGRLACDV